MKYYKTNYDYKALEDNVTSEGFYKGVGIKFHEYGVSVIYTDRWPGIASIDIEIDREEFVKQLEKAQNLLKDFLK